MPPAVGDSAGALTMLQVRDHICDSLGLTMADMEESGSAVRTRNTLLFAMLVAATKTMPSPVVGQHRAAYMHQYVPIRQQHAPRGTGST